MDAKAIDNDAGSGTMLTADELRARFTGKSHDALRARLRGDLREAARLQREAVQMKRWAEIVLPVMVKQEAEAS